MANEARLQVSLQIRNGTQNYQSRPSAFAADVSSPGGPSPGQITATEEGTDVDLSELTTPGLCRIMNLDATNYVEYGIREPATLSFYPLGELLPGESFVLRLSRNLGEEYVGTGTGTSASTNFLHFKANGDSCRVLVEAFER